LIVVFKGGKGGFGDLSVEELLVNGRDKINIPDQISGMNSVLINNTLDLFVGQTEAQKACGS
jgi:hypothetical protein